MYVKQTFTRFILVTVRTKNYFYRINEERGELLFTGSMKKRTKVYRIDEKR